MGITASALLVELNISVWTANKVDKSATRKVADDNNATRDAGLFRKNLLAGTNLRKDIADFAASCRLWHNTQTLPWADRGPRLLPTSRFMSYRAEMGSREVYYEEMVENLISKYPELLAAAPLNLGSLFDPNDYPSVDAVRNKFGFRLVFSPVPESGDFRLDLPAQEMEEMKRQYDAAFNDRLADAMREPWDRLHTMISTMMSKLEDSDDVETKRRWHDTFLSNATNLCDLLVHLNLTNDPQLEAARKDLQKAVQNMDLSRIKESAAERADARDELDNILKRYSW